MHLPQTRPLFHGACVALAVTLLLATSSSGQYGGVQVPKAVDIKGWKAAEFAGKVDSTKGSMLTALNFGNERIFVYVMPQYLKSLSVKGTAEPSAIKQGMGIRFVGKMDEKGVVADKVTELYLVTHEGPLSECAINEDTEVAGTIVSNDNKGNIKATINGVKKEVKGEKELITKRVKLVTFQVADDAKISVDLKDISLARANDTVTVVGKQVKNNNVDNPFHIIAEVLTIELTEPLSGLKRKPSSTKEPKEGKEKADAFKEGAKQAGDEEKMEATKKEPAKKDAPKKAEEKKAEEKKARLGED